MREGCFERERRRKSLMTRRFEARIWGIRFGGMSLIKVTNCDLRTLRSQFATSKLEVTNCDFMRPSARNRMRMDHERAPAFSIFVQLSFSDTARLNTGRPGVE